MITPAFELSQDPDFLTISIRVPYARVSEFDVYYEGEDFKFYAKPYFLRLTLPGRIVEDGREKASYNAEEGIFTVQIPKETPGQHFEGLSMLTALLAPKRTRSAKPLVEEIGAPADLEEDEDFDWQIEQTPFEETADVLNPPCSYGFGNLRSGVFKRLQDELSDVIDLKDPDATLPADCRQKRLAAEDAKFDASHYLADLFDDEAIQHILTYKAWWIDGSCPSGKTEVSEETKCQEPDNMVSFSEEEKEQLRKFTNKSYLLDKRSHRQVFLSLIDILLAYSYEICVTEGEKNVESSWNIRKLSGTLCWLESYTCVQDVLVSFGRRVLSYPLYRHFSLVTKAIRDVTILLQLGKAAVLKCLLDIHKIFQENDPAYILNDLYVTDYCIWIQKVKSKKLAALGKILQTSRLSKADMNFELEELEAAARLVKEEEDEAQAAGSEGRGRLDTAELETSDSEGSTSTSTSETESSEFSEEESSEEGDVQINDSEDALQERSLTANTDSSKCNKTTDTSQSASIPGEVIEKLGARLYTAVVLSDTLEGGTAHNSGTLQNEAEEYAVGVVHSAKKPHQGDNFLEVSPRKNLLLVVGNSDEEGSGVN
ncbi:protein SHQ1 homolog [Microcaecilia unicolor]|uniref:Protein SHQ1 homolog n=1 Tax=Microcaecilia unicolor TaxID=1415580 RepID=A0A6P7YI63_9AMPH|nr:protein SHQ1 homolog [Microcaecilia unicolor]XP_030062745.1 protein SHQ1 homolog [Microcaecilia unicolor]XP_030062746.1 protein SHQ1 homolog [Microcaecilia unicolor]XP_030062747.1 protein SHQ1 homolog [Microcaecilia unicolor]XP_030062748.1 protein SHQ1 homolog [Microcaecilia unicolor]